MDINKLFADSNLLGEDHDASVVNGATLQYAVDSCESAS